MTARTARTFIALGMLLGASPTSFAQGQPDVCVDSFFAWQYTQCATPQAIEGRRARGIPEPAQPEDPMLIRARRREAVNARTDDQPQPLGQAQGIRTASGAARPE